MTRLAIADNHRCHAYIYAPHSFARKMQKPKWKGLTRP